ncbi:MAG: hypothetical protein OEM59_03295 [Rhodospirillales bacterium]|nr:hypothetical protein [Rhodospirillales bacterium]
MSGEAGDAGAQDGNTNAAPQASSTNWCLFLPAVVAVVIGLTLLSVAIATSLGLPKVGFAALAGFVVVLFVSLVAAPRTAAQVALYAAVTLTAGLLVEATMVTTAAFFQSTSLGGAIAGLVATAVWWAVPSMLRRCGVPVRRLPPKNQV